VEVIVFPDLYRNSLQILQKDTPLIIKGTLDKTEKGIKIVSSEIVRLDSLVSKGEQKVEISLRYPLPESTNLHRLKSVLLSQGKGTHDLYLRISLKNSETLIATGMKISPDRETLHMIEEITGKGAVVLK